MFFFSLLIIRWINYVFNIDEFRITGTYVWYYCICKREVWLLSRGITPDQSDENMEIGRFLHEKAYAREKKK